MRSVISFLIFSVLLMSCNSKVKQDDENTDPTADETTVESSAASLNTLTESEQADGWQLLFDGKSMDQWTRYGTNDPADRWTISDDALYFDKSLKKDGPDQNIRTIKEYENFEFQYEWKIEACGNSGVIFNVTDDGSHTHPWETGPEMQVLDDSCHPDAKFPKHRAGDLYDLIEMSKKVVKPAGEWNSAGIISNNNHVEFWMNGERVVEFTMHTDEWKEMVANSKFKSMKDFGTTKKGYIVLQDHGDNVWFRNLKIKELN